MNETTEKQVINEQEYKADLLMNLYEEAVSAATKKDRVFKVIAAVDNGEQWSISKQKVRRNQSLPVSNTLSNIRDTRQGALYVNGFAGEFLAKTDRAEPFANQLTQMMTSLWRQSAYDTVTTDCYSNTLTFGTGITLVTGGFIAPKGESKYIDLNNIQLTNIDPSSFYVEPGVKTEDEASYFFYKDIASLNYLRTNPLFREKIEANIDKINTHLRTLHSGAQQIPSDTSSNSVGDQLADFITYFGRAILPDGSYRWDMVYLFGNTIIHKIEGIQPNKMPFAIAREYRDKNSFWGQSTYKKNLALQLSVNELDSSVLTYTKQQGNPVTVIHNRSGINAQTFANHRDDPNATFVSKTDPDKTVSYVGLPNLPQQITQMSTILIDRIKESTGVGDMYTGNSSKSLQTTGGIQQVLNRASLKDLKILKHFQKYLRDLYILIIEHLKISNGIVRYSTLSNVEGERNYKELDLSTVPWSELELIVDMENHTGSAKEQNKAVINEMFQFSMQYGSSQPLTEPAIMTVDEYLTGLMEPNIIKLFAQIQERRKQERELNLAEQITKIIMTYLKLVESGAAPEEAIILTAEEYNYDPGLLKGLTMADLAKQMSTPTDPGGPQGQNNG